jgi:hypothetical protein
MKEDGKLDTKMEAIFAELCMQRNDALNRCALLNAEVVVLKERVKQLEEHPLTKSEMENG